MDTTGTVNDLFDRAVALEKAAEEFYRRLVGIFACEPDVSKFWRGYADEERGHASFLEQVRVKLSPDILSQPGNDSMLGTAQKGLEHSTRAMNSDIQNLDDAYQMAVELENSETNAVFEFIMVNFPVEELAKTQAFLRVQLSKHAMALEKEFPTKYKSRLARMNVKAQIPGG